MGAPYPLKSNYFTFTLVDLGRNHDEPSPLYSVLHEVDEVLLINAGILGLPWERAP